MILPQRQKHLGVHSTLFGLLLFVVANLNEVNLSKVCQPKRRYPVHLVNETDIPADTAKLNSSIINALEAAIPGGLCSPTIRTFNQSDQPKGFTIAELELSVSKNDGFEIFEDLLLKGVNYTLENRTLNMMPYSRVFVARFNVTNPDDANDTYIEQAIKEVLKEETVIVTYIANVSEFKTFRLWLNRSGSYYPVEALKTLIDAVENNQVKGLVVSKDSFKAYMVYPFIETRDFRVEFDYSMMECVQSSMSNASSHEYQSTKKGIEKILKENFKVLQNFSSVAVTDLKCSSSVVRDASTFARITAVLKLHRSSKKTPSEIGQALQSCPTSKTNVSNLQVTLLTPQSFEDVTEAKIICPSTTTLKPTTLKTQSDTTLPSSEPSTSPPSMGKTPRVFVRLRLAITWSQFCTKLEDSLKQNIAKNVYDKKGNVVSPDRVIFINSRKNCADPLKENDLVDLWFYIAERSGTDRPSTCVTLKAQRVLRMMVNNGNTKMLGNDFAGKVVSASLAGCDAQKIDKKDEDMNWTVLIIIAIIVGALLLLLACCCICCGAARRRRRKRYEDKQMELIIVDSAHVQANGEETGVSSLGGKDGDQGKKGGKRGGKGAKHGHSGGRAAGMYGGISDTDSDDYYDCCGGGIAGAHRGKKARDNKGKKNGKNKEMDGNKSDANKDDASNGDSKGNNNDNDAKNVEGTSNEGYEDLRLDKNAQDDQEKSPPQSYQNLSYGLGDRKPSNGSTYATIADPVKRPSQDGGHQYVNIKAGSQEQSQQGSPAISSAAAGSLAGSLSDGNNRSGQTPAIVTSPAPADNGTPTYDNVSGASLGDRGTSSSKSGTPVSSRRPSSGNSLNNIDDEQLRERRRSSIHSLVDDGAEPLKHKTATVGIVGLALRNKNERKKETEFKNLDKEMPALGTYAASTAGKNRFPEILPNPRSRVRLTSSPDYINASYLHDHKGQRQYIATQHPLVETKDDFWQMVWDQDSHLIVMVNDDENSKQIDYPNYWPTAEGNSMEHNGIVVTNKQTVTKADYVITTLVITNNKVTPSISREITHYRYTSWKNKDQMPNVAMFVGFVVATREIGKKYEDGKSPVIVHCSDGQGFTGVFIALDIGIRSHEESKTSVVDLFELAKRLRQGRSGIINSLQLYNFAYQCLYEYTVNYDEEAEKKNDA